MFFIRCTVLRNVPRVLNGGRSRESEREGANTRREIARKRKRGGGGEVEIGGPVAAC